MSNVDLTKDELDILMMVLEWHYPRPNDNEPLPELKRKLSEAYRKSEGKS